MSDYLAVIERDGESWGAYCPDLPGVGVVAETRDEAEELIRVAVELHLSALQNAGEPIPEPSAIESTVVHVSAAG